MRRLFPAGAALLAACLTCAPAAAQGDPEAGRTKAYTCTGCHGIPGYMNVYPSYRVPKLGGQSEEYIVSAISAYAEGRREHPTMEAQARSLSEQDVADIAAYFASLGGDSE